MVQDSIGASCCSIDTALIHAGTDRILGSAVMPIFQSISYAHCDSDNAHKPTPTNLYSRPADTPNHKALAAKIAALEGAEASVVSASGMAAISSTLLTLLRPGDHLMIQAAVYGGTYELVHHELVSLGIAISVIDQTDPETWREALRPNTKVIYVEAISNPLLEMADLEGIAAFARQHGLTHVIDNTFATPVLLRPASLGFIVIHSATKYLNGHSDVLAGVVSGPAAFIQKVTTKMVMLGPTLDPHACFLLQRGLATLALRVRQQCANAMALAQFLEAQPQIERVAYPGLPSSRFHPLAQKYLGGRGGGVLAFEVRGGKAAAEALLKALKLPLVAPSLGSVESLITMPCNTTHAALGEEGRKAAGISESLVRLAVGIEGTQDLVLDFAQALDATFGMRKGAAANDHAVASLRQTLNWVNGVSTRNPVSAETAPAVVWDESSAQ